VNPWLAVPSPSPTGTPPVADLADLGGSGTFWLVVLGLIVFVVVVRAVNQLLGWGSHGDEGL
jgi:hypothetical protein